MSDSQPIQIPFTEVAVDQFQAIVINKDRVGILAALTSQAVEHFGHDRLRITNLRVSGDDPNSTYFATATFASSND